MELDYRDRDTLVALLRDHPSDRRVAEYLSEQGTVVSESAIGKYRRKFGIPIPNEAYRYRNVAKAPLVPPTDPLAGRLQDYLSRQKQPSTLEGLCDHFAVCPREMREAIANLEQGAALLKVTPEGISLDDAMPPGCGSEIIDWHKYREVEVPFGITADSHIGSKYERLDVLEAAFDYWQSEGITTVYHMGNMIDGEKRGINEYDIYVRGFEDQVANLIEKWPRREGMTTHFITGLCHEGWYIKQNKINVGRRIEQEARDRGREDVRFLGHLEHDLHFQQEGGEARVRLFHAGGGSAYATSYKPQKIVESYQGGEKPNALFIGHFHKYDTGYPREVYELQCGCTQDQTPWMRQHNIAAHVGFVTLWMTQNELGLITGWKVKWKPFYDRKFYQFHW